MVVWLCCRHLVFSAPDRNRPRTVPKRAQYHYQTVKVNDSMGDGGLGDVFEEAAC